MNQLRVSQLKPNPAGKDRTRYGGATPAQLGAEWVDLKNLGPLAVNLDGLSLHHLAYPAGGGRPAWSLVCNLRGNLPAGQVLRVHSGRVRETSVLRGEDLQGAHFHAFSGKDEYVWNNAEGDTALVWREATKVREDEASYDPFPPEGVILVRSGAKLIPVGRQAMFGR